MTQNITTYYIPQNLNISKGKIYTLYLTKTTNLDLASILPQKSITLNGMIQPNKQVVSTPKPNPTVIPSPNTVTISNEDYANILSIINATNQLYQQSMNLEKKLTQGRK